MYELCITQNKYQSICLFVPLEEVLVREPRCPEPSPFLPWGLAARILITEEDAVSTCVEGTESRTPMKRVLNHELEPLRVRTK